MVPEVLVLKSDEDVESRRRALLGQVGVAEEELRRRGADYLLTENEAVVLRELENLDYLSSDD